MSETLTAVGTSERAASQNGAGTNGRVGTTLPPALGAAPHLGSNGARRLSKGQILSGYKAQLHEYRVLKDELAPWTQAFAAKHGRKPRIVDVERTGTQQNLHPFSKHNTGRQHLKACPCLLCTPPINMWAPDCL